MNKALFLDRDGVINKEKNYLYKIQDFEFIDGVFESCRYFQDNGYLIVIITNQAGIARGKYNEDDYYQLNNWMLNEFRTQCVDIARVYHCPHHPDYTGDCDCRKPKPGMILQARNELTIDLKNSILVGDKESDVCAGFNAGVGTNYLINTGHKINKNIYNVPILESLKNLTMFV